MDYKEYINFLQGMKDIIKKHDGKVFGKRFETDIKQVFPNAFISHNYGLQYVYNGYGKDQDRLHIGWDKRPIEATRLLSEIDRTIEIMNESMNKRDAELNKLDELRLKFKQAKELIEELDELHHEIQDNLKKEFDIDFKTYYRG